MSTSTRPELPFVSDREVALVGFQWCRRCTANAGIDVFHKCTFQCLEPLKPPVSGLAYHCGRKISLKPFISGRSSPARHSSFQAAAAVTPSRGAKTARYLELLRRLGPLSDHEAKDLLGVPLSSVNSIRNGLGNQVVACGWKDSPYRNLRIVAWGVR